MAERPPGARTRGLPLSPRIITSLFAARTTGETHSDNSEHRRVPLADRAAHAAGSARLTCSTGLATVTRLSGQARDALGGLSKPSRLTLGAAAAAAIAVTGVMVGVSAGGTPALGSAGRPAAVSDDAGAAGQHHVARAASPAARTAAHQAAPVHRTAAHTAAPARHRAQARHAARHAAAPKPYLIYDSVTPSSIPRYHVIATYATGGYAVSHAQVASRKHVLWIDTTGFDHSASVLDVEPGDATPSMAAHWAWSRLHSDPHALARIYTMRSEWSAVQAAVSRLPAGMRSHVRWWIADPTGVPHVVPGSQATQWYWGSSYDITTATPRF